MGDTAAAITGDTAGAITAATLVRWAGLYKTESASRIAATETPLEAASVGGLSLSGKVGNPMSASGSKRIFLGPLSGVKRT
jgi:hypothetical protein